MSEVLVESPLRVSPTRARVAIALFFFVSGFGFATWASRIPVIQHRLGLSAAELGGVLLALPAGLMLTLPVTGQLLQRFSSRQVMLVGAVLYNLALGLLGFAAHTWQLAVLLFCFGCSRNLLNLSVNAQSVGVQTLYDRSIIATFHGIWSVAGFAAAGLGALLISHDVSTTVHFAAVSMGLTALAFAFFSNTLALPPASEKKSFFTWPEKTVLKYGLITFASMACEGTFYDWSGVYFSQAAHAPKAISGLGFTLYMVAMTSGRFLGDWLVGRFGIKQILQASGLLMSTGLLLAAAFPTPVVAGLGFVLGGLGVSCVVPLVFSLVGRANPLSAGAAIASVSTVSYFGFLMVPPLVGFVAKAASLRWSFALVSVLGLLVVWVVPKLRVEGEK
ncbi:MFS transporter [Hymenobacter sp. 5317J-9]|uniref:MFS transporter n=1 Tax=Hymenobacter sp. 5317J-9 TaxID=2932250 RepID=UPI001FD6E30A|nr:MFS transporter [Hymenobacter sp. 5317J-9]UOQ96563.1 MFS transporter [Hymenobacter sp. 5317J-9]